MSATPLATRREKYNVRILLERLTASTHGCSCVINLAMAFKAGILPPDKVFNALKSFRRSDTVRMRDIELLGELKTTLQDATFGLYRYNPRNGEIPSFCNRGHIVTVMSWDTYAAHYAHADDLMSGHRLDVRPPGAKNIRYKPGAKTATLFWAAPYNKFVTPDVTKSEAETSRDMLGLVHHFDDQRLVALHMTLPSGANAYRPTVVEAVPNSRFRQVNPHHTAEGRWGFTVDLSKLIRSTSIRDDLAGVPELIFDQVELPTCVIDGFYHLGKTKTAQDTNHADNAFLEQLLQGATISSFIDELHVAFNL